LFAIPFSLRLRIYKDSGRWNNLPQAFYHEHLELFLGNACLGNLLRVSTLTAKTRLFTVDLPLSSGQAWLTLSHRHPPVNIVLYNFTLVGEEGTLFATPPPPDLTIPSILSNSVQILVFLYLHRAFSSRKFPLKPTDALFIYRNIKRG
jgi:hypothetical protein